MLARENRECSGILVLPGPAVPVARRSTGEQKSCFHDLIGNDEYDAVVAAAASKGQDLVQVAHEFTFCRSGVGS